MNLATVFHETERIKSKENSLVIESLDWLRSNGYDHYTYNYIEKKAPVNLVEVLKFNNFLNGNQLLTLFGHVENLNKNLSRNEEAKPLSNRPQSLLLPVGSMSLARHESTKNRWSCRISSSQSSTNRYNVFDDCSSIVTHGVNQNGEILHTNKEKTHSPVAVAMSHVDSEAQCTRTSPGYHHVDRQNTSTAHKYKVNTVLKSPAISLSRKSKLIGCTKHNSLTTVIEQHTNDDYNEVANHNRDNNKQFFPLNSSDSDNSSLFSILSEPSSNPSSLYSPLTRQRNHKDSRMSFNPISSTVPEISVGLTGSDIPSTLDEDHVYDDDTYLLKPVVKPGNTLGVSDSSQSSGCNRRSFNSWGYDFDLGTGSEDLSNDSIDMGEAGRINFRTGSFMTRYRRNSKLSGNQISPKPGVKSPTQQCTNWALCQDDNSHSGNENVEDELNPILDNLLSDMDSLDSFRNSMYNRKSIDLTDNFHSKKVSSLRRDCKHMHLDMDNSSTLNQKIDDLIHSEKGEPMPLDQSESQTTNENQNKKLNKKSASTRKRNHPFRWSSLARSNQPEESSHDMELSYFSINQFLILKKLAMLKLTSVLEKYIPSQRSQFNWKFPKLLSTKMKPLDSAAEVFGIPLSDWQSKIGQPLPPVIYHALKYVRQIGPDADGIFRRAGGKARINELKKEIDNNPDLNDFSNWQPYDVADMIKSFFRSLPECLMTNKFSTTLISIITYIPEQQWLETIQWGIINLPDENRLVLQSLLYFLSDLAKHSEKTKMTSINLAVCLSPSLFHSPHSMGSSAVSPMRMRKNNQGPDPRDLASQKATHICLKFMIDHAACLFRISEETINKAHIQLEFDKSISLGKLLHGSNDWYRWIREKVDNVMSEYHHRFKNWTSMRKDIFKHHQDKNHLCQGFEIFYKKNLSSSDKANDNTIGTWRITADLDASAAVIIEKILNKRHEWDPEIKCFAIKREISDSVDICQMEVISNPPQVNRNMTLIRGCQRKIEGHINVIVSHSIEDQWSTIDKRYPLANKSMNVPERPFQNIAANVIQEDIIVESLSSNHKARINWLSRVDLRGLSSDWYFRQWSHVLIRRLIYLKLALS